MPNAIRILIVDDEPDLRELVSYNLTKEGYEVSEAATGDEALDMVRKDPPDLVVLDLMLPGIQGMELCRMMRSSPKTASLPIIMLTAKTEETDKVLGLEIGADDYITKPFSPRELLARVRAVLRRTGSREVPEEKKEDANVLQIGELVINGETYSVTKRDRPISLSATEFRLLQYMAQRPGRVLSRDRLLDSVWKDEAFVEPRTVDVHIRRLRAQIEDDPSNPRYIKTRRGIGYYMEGEE
jgi:phosphate regulon transcriptional regulator PhoB